MNFISSIDWGCVLTRTFLASGLTLTVNTALAADWPMAAHNVANARHASEETTISVDNVARLRPIATLTTSGNNWATPVVVEEGVFFPDSGGMLCAADPKDGSVLWSKAISDYNGVPRSVSRVSAAYANGMIFVGDRGGANLSAIRAETGELAWITDLEEHANAQVTGSPIVVGDRVYIGVSSAGA